MLALQTDQFYLGYVICITHVAVHKISLFFLWKSPRLKIISLSFLMLITAFQFFPLFRLSRGLSDVLNFQLLLISFNFICKQSGYLTNSAFPYLPVLGWKYSKLTLMSYFQFSWKLNKNRKKLSFQKQFSPKCENLQWLHFPLDFDSYTWTYQPFNYPSATV